MFSPMDSKSDIPAPLDRVDVERTTITDSDEQKLQSIDDVWDGSSNDRRSLGIEWTGETLFQLNAEDVGPPGHTYVMGRWVRNQITNRPPNVWPEVWNLMSKKQRKTAKADWDNKMDEIRVARDKVKHLIIKDKLGTLDEAGGDSCKEWAERSHVKAMPVVPSGKQEHREKLWEEHPDKLALVARPVKPAEIASNPRAKKAVDEEWEKLRKITTWKEKEVREYDDVVKEAKGKSKEVHFGRVFSLCHEKHSEDPTKSKYKGRVVFQGNQVTDQTATMASFQEIGSSACLLTASKIADVIACEPGNGGEQSDAPQAYTQAELKGNETWVELPKENWPAEWFKKDSGGRLLHPLYRRPVCPLRLALYWPPRVWGVLGETLQ